MGSLHTASDRFRVRLATKADASDMTDVYFDAWTGPFWNYFLPDNKVTRSWWDEAWKMGIENPTDRSFVVEDTQNNNRIVGISRWQIPQADGNQDRMWPDLPEAELDMEVADAFFGGMHDNRLELMEKRPHWMLEMLGVRPDYQKHGIAATLIKWGTDQADASGLETYLDASAMGNPYYRKRHHFGSLEKPVPIPDRPAYGSYVYTSLVRAPQKQA